MIVLVIAGLDPSAGAGVALDLRVVAAHGGLGLPVVTTATIQSSAGVRGHAPVAPVIVHAQIQAVLADLPVAAVKIGALGSAAVADAVAAALRDLGAPVVLDPVLGATRGAALLDRPEALAGLLPGAALVTPNLAEAAALVGAPVPDRAGMRAAARALLGRGARAVLVKGGHLEGAPVDLLADADGELELVGRRVPGEARGTGCALSSAIAARLAQGEPLRAAVGGAKAWLEEALEAAVPMGTAGRRVILGSR